jgi:hypothetical protein
MTVNGGRCRPLKSVEALIRVKDYVADSGSESCESFNHKNPSSDFYAAMKKEHAQRKLK